MLVETSQKATEGFLAMQVGGHGDLHEGECFHKYIQSMRPFGLVARLHATKIGHPAGHSTSANAGHPFQTKIQLWTNGARDATLDSPSQHYEENYAIRFRDHRYGRHIVNRRY